MVAIESEIYFRIQVSWLDSFKKTEMYLRTKFRRDISTHSWVKTTSGFGKRTAAILEYYFRFQLWHNFRHRRIILHQSAKFRQNRTTLGGVMTSYPFFSRWRPAAILIWVMLDHPRSAIVVLSLVFKFGVDPIYSFWDIAIFIFWRFGLKLSVPAHFYGVLGACFPQMWSPIVLTAKRHLRKSTSYEP